MTDGTTGPLLTENAQSAESRLSAVTRQLGAHTHQLRVKLADGSLVMGLADMTDAPTIRETADHAELAAELRAFEGSDDLGNGDFTVCEFAADALENLLSEIAALRGEVERVQRECDEMALHGFQAVQAERQRDEAVGLLRELADGRSQKNNINEYDDLSVRASTLLANQGADQ